MAACVAGFDDGCRMGVETIPFTLVTPIHTRDAVSTGLLQVQLRIDEIASRSMRHSPPPR
jgi:hypothetical protein